VDKIRETICRKTDDQCGPHIATSATGYQAIKLACIRKVQKEWDEKKRKPASIPWEPPKPLNFHLLTALESKLQKKPR